jgi:ATP-dependent Lon protease
MRESAQAAMSIVRARAKQWKIPQSTFRQTDIHVHVPAGGIPKDGPSAGVAMLTSLVSLLSGKAADPATAMTGEITLRGQVLPIGGVKAKVLAAHRAGIKTVILPTRTEPDVREVPEDVRAELRFVFAATVEDVLDTALAAPARRTPARTADPKTKSDKKKTRPSQASRTKKKRTSPTRSAARNRSARTATRR